MIVINKTQEDCKDRKEYLIRLTIEYLNHSAQFLDSRICYDDAECDGFCLADDLAIEFDID